MDLPLNRTVSARSPTILVGLPRYRATYRIDSDDSGDLCDYGLLPRQSETQGDRGTDRGRQSETEGDRGTDRGDLSDYGMLPKLPTDATYAAAAAAHYDTRI